MSDGVLEVVGVTDVLHLAYSLGGLSNGVRLCQGSSISIRAPAGGVPLQIDGEPFNIDARGPGGSEPFDMTISIDGQALMLSRGGGGGGASAYATVERELAEGHLSTAQRNRLLTALGRDA